MKPIGGIVTNKESVPDNLRKIDSFTTEDLSKLWKVYTVNRDVLDKGPRLENLFWRIWASERTNRPFSGFKVAEVFMKIYQGDELPVPVFRKRLQLPPAGPIAINTPTPPAQESEDASRCSLEIQCPPTPPPSPLPTSSRGSYTGDELARLPPHHDITASLQQAFPPQQSPARSGPVSGVSTTPRQMPTIAENKATPTPTPWREEEENQKQELLGVVAVDRTDTQSSNSRSSWSSAATSASSSESWSPEKSAKPSTARARSPAPSSRRKKPSSNAAGTGPLRTSRGLRPAPPSRKKSASAANTSASSPAEAAAPTTSDVVRSLPQVRPRNPPRRQDSTISEPDRAENTDPAPTTASRPRLKKAAESGGSGGSGNSNDAWVVDLDFRSKYLERKRKESILALASIDSSAKKTAPTTAVAQNFATAHSHTLPSSRRNGAGRRKNVLIVDDVVPLKGVEEEPEATGGSKRSKANGSASTQPRGMGVKDGIMPRNARDSINRRSELSMLFETAKGDEGGEGDSAVQSYGKS